MIKPRCCLDDSEISEFMSFESNSAAGRAMERSINLKNIKTSAQLSTDGLHVIISSCELMIKPRCCLAHSEISEFMSFESNFGACCRLQFFWRAMKFSHEI